MQHSLEGSLELKTSCSRLIVMKRAEEPLQPEAQSSHFSTNLTSTSLAISTSSPSMFQGEVTPCGWMMGDVLEFLSSSLSSSSSSDQHTWDSGRIFTADTACVSTKEKLNCRGRQKPAERSATSKLSYDVRLPFSFFYETVLSGGAVHLATNRG